MTFDQYIGLEYAERTEDDGEPESRARVRIQAHHQNPTGAINGGVFLSLADNIATGVAGDAYRQKFTEDAFMVGVDVHATLLSNQQGGEILGVARIVRCGKRVTVVRTQITGESGKLLAEVTTTHVPVSRA